ncbi:MAG: nucleotidyltransferase domain-containing protein [Gammaproteobacteria bacterium]|nr:nucleotidyltransferase domain-containing protein [Gammaproteobacteria bacterium]
MRSVFSRYGGIERVILYGSRAMGTHRPGSDIDLTVTGDLGPGEVLMLENELDDLLLPQKIDLSLHRFIDNPELLAHIDRVGRTLYERS